MSDDTEDLDDRRDSGRYTQEESIIVQVVPHSKVVPIRNKPIYGETVDISQRGVQVCLDHPLPAQSSIALWVDLETIHKRILLVGEVIWCKQQSENNSYLVGIELSLENSEEADNWYDLLSMEKQEFEKSCQN